MSVNIDRFIQCMRLDKEFPDGSIQPGHNFIPRPAYIEDEVLHMDIQCKWCGYICQGEKPYQGETPEEIHEIYGFRLDEPFENV